MKKLFVMASMALALVVLAIGCGGVSQKYVDEALAKQAAENRAEMTRWQASITKDVEEVDAKGELIVEEVEASNARLNASLAKQIEEYSESQQRGNQAAINQTGENFQKTINLATENMQALILEQDQDIFDLSDDVATIEENVVELVNSTLAVWEKHLQDTVEGLDEALVASVCTLDYWRVANLIATSILTEYLNGDDSWSPDSVWEAAVDPPAPDIYNEHSVTCVIEDGFFYLIDRDQ